MREIDRVAVEETGPNLLQMMENAGRNLALQCLEIAGPEWRQRRMLVSLDVPSGVDATTGATPGAAIQPRWTLTLALPKTGLRPENAGQLVLADIGIPAETFRRAGVTMVNPFGAQFRIPLMAS